MPGAILPKLLYMSCLPAAVELVGFGLYLVSIEPLLTCCRRVFNPKRKL